jgi:tRNA threonylcarbamoyladenosine biosynthesis protein TsaB
MKILAVETATEACSAALLANDEIIGNTDGTSTLPGDACSRIVERYRLAPREHNRLILPMIEAVLAEAGLAVGQLDALAFGRGPGSFTGVRIAAGVAQGIAFGADLPVIPVSTLAALAQEAFDETDATLAYPCIDARMGEVYWGVYRRNESGLAQLAGEEGVLAAASVPFPKDGRGAGIGSGWGTYGAALQERLERRVTVILEHRYPRAAKIARLAAEAFRAGIRVQPEQALPVYLRDNVAKPQLRPKAV